MNWDQERARLNEELAEIKAEGGFKSWKVLALEIGITGSQLHGFRFKADYHASGTTDVARKVRSFVQRWRKGIEKNAENNKLGKYGIWSTLNRTSPEDVHRNGELYGRYTGFEFGPRQNQTRAIELLLFEEKGLTKFCFGERPLLVGGYADDDGNWLEKKWRRFEGVCCRNGEELLLLNSETRIVVKIAYLRDVVCNGMPNILKGVVFDLNGDYAGKQYVAAYKVFLSEAKGKFSIPSNEELASGDWGEFLSWSEKMNYRKKKKVNWDVALQKVSDEYIPAILEMEWFGDPLLVWQQASEYWMDGYAGILLRGMFPDAMRLFQEEN